MYIISHTHFGATVYKTARGWSTDIKDSSLYPSLNTATIAAKGSKFGCNVYRLDHIIREP